MTDIRVTNDEELQAALIAAEYVDFPVRIWLSPGDYYYGPSVTIPDGTTLMADVRDFGAKGDQVTDDAPAIQAALDALDRLDPPKQG